MEGGTLIIGLGKTGLSCARYLANQGDRFSVMDNRNRPPCIEQLTSELPEVSVYLGDFDREIISMAQRLIVSPGISLHEPVIAEANRQGKLIIGDIELFAQNANAPIIAITGSNGKSTVTSLVGEMGRQAKMNIPLGGNIGTPALQLLIDQSISGNAPDYFVLELSSFQLETTRSLRAYAGVILNISEDHMDRYESLNDYVNAKAKVFNGDGYVIFNRDDPEVQAIAMGTGDINSRRISFGLNVPEEGQFGLREKKGKTYLAHGLENLLSVEDMRITGYHNYANALAAMALAWVMGISREAAITTLRNYTGLAHRTQWVAEVNAVNWYNDSKATNVGASVAAINGLPGKKILIAGGDGKGADFLPLRAAVENGNVRSVILIGRDAKLIEQVLTGVVKIVLAQDMINAVSKANSEAHAGDSVLLSPACASFDMFTNYEARGAAFCAAVERLN